MRRLGSGLAAALFIFLAAPATAARAADAPAAVTVSMKQFAFMPATVTIQAGGTVTWTYDEKPTDVPPGCETPPISLACPGHSSTANEKRPDGSPLWNSGLHKADGFPFTVRLDTPGTYTYYCVVHGGAQPNNPLTAMNGTVVVAARPAGTTGGASGAGTTPTTTAAAVKAGRVLPLTGGPGNAWAALAGVALGAALFCRRCRTSA